MPPFLRWATALAAAGTALLPGTLFGPAHALPGSRATSVSPTLWIAPAGEPGSRLTISGGLVDRQGRPIAGAELHLYQTDARGRYTFAKPLDEAHARLAGRLKTGTDGRFEIRTIRPGAYPNAVKLNGIERWIPAHIHIDVRAAGHPERRFQLVFADDARLKDEYWSNWVRSLRQPVLATREVKGTQVAKLLLRLDS